MVENMLFKRNVPINEYIAIKIPTVEEVVDNEQDYYTMVSMLTAMPIDLMVQLDDMGIDYTTIDEYELFLLLFNGLKGQDTTLVFGDLDLNKFRIASNTENGEIVLVDKDNDYVIDRGIYLMIARTLRKIHHLEKNVRKPANEAAREYLLERARTKAKRNRRKMQESQIEPLIIAMVNTEQFKYDFESTKQLTIYQFNESVRQIIKKVDYDNRMFGVYSGTISAKDLSQNDLNWLTNK